MLLWVMRIIAGEFRRRLLETPRDAETTRPIPDRVKESLFSLLRGHCEGASVFDAFAGTGAIGLEAVSRGANRCVMVERDRHVAEMLRRNVETLGCLDRCEVVSGDALGAGALARCPRPCTLVFMDPPYPLIRDGLGFRRVMDQLSKLVECLTPDGFAVLRTPWPLLLEAGGEEEASPEPARRKGKPRKERRGRWDEPERPRRAPRAERFDEETIERIETEGAEEGEGDKPVFEKPSLLIANAVGPETHEYGTMAVHLYARKKT